MAKTIAGVTLPLASVLAAFWFGPAIAPSASESQGLIVGVSVAAVLSLATMGALKWSLNRPSFYWVWGGGMLARMAGAGVTAAVVVLKTDLSLPWTLIPLVLATLVFVVLEAVAFFH